MEAPISLTMKKCIIFDLDGTLTASKAPLDREMAGLLAMLLSRTKVAVISGAAFHQFEKQFLAFLHCPDGALGNLFIVPTNGSAMYVYQGARWVRIYAEELSAAERKKIFEAFETVFKETNFIPEKRIYGEIIEDRGTQVTFSGLGQLAPVERKKAWDTDKKKRLRLKEGLDRLLPDLEIKINSSSSIDITRKGIDKAYGVLQIQKHLRIPIKDMVFVGDAIFPGGNDYAATTTGIEAVGVSDEQETKALIRSWLGEGK